MTHLKYITKVMYFDPTQLYKNHVCCCVWLLSTFIDAFCYYRGSFCYYSASNILWRAVSHSAKGSSVLQPILKYIFANCMTQYKLYVYLHIHIRLHIKHIPTHTDTKLHTQKHTHTHTHTHTQTRTHTHTHLHDQNEQMAPCDRDGCETEPPATTPFLFVCMRFCVPSSSMIPIFRR